MEVETFVLIAVVALVAAIVGFLAARRWAVSRALDDTAFSKNMIAAGLKLPPLSSSTPETSPLRQLAPIDDCTVAGDLVVLGDDGEVLLSCREIDSLPPMGGTDDTQNDAALNRARQLATELITRSLVLPGKTVEIAFDSAIQRGLHSGAYEVVKVASGDGQRLMARALDSKKFVGQGRFMEAGKLKQLGVGAFHIVSIAVAQAHLAEINENLKEIKEGVNDIQYFLDDKDIGQLIGTIDYLTDLVHFIRRLDSPDRLSIEKRAQLETIRREISIWVAQIEREASRLDKRIKNQGDVDGLSGGTGKTFKKLKEHVGATERLIRKYRLFLRMASLFYMISAYLDPMALRIRDVTRILQPDAATNALFCALQQLERKSDTLLGRAIWNKKATLYKRQQELVEKVRNLNCQIRDQTIFFAEGMDRLERQLNKIGHSQGHMRMAITFDNGGNPAHVKLL